MNKLWGNAELLTDSQELVYHMVWRGQGYKFDLHQQHSKIRTIKIYNYAPTEVLQ